MIAVSAVAAADAATSRTELPHRGSVVLCSLDEVRLAGDGCLARAVRADVEYVRALDVDRLLAPFRREAGIRSSAHPYGHWESMGLDGHTLGHWLSAVSHLVASGNDADGELSRRLEYAVGELAKCQEKTGGRLDGIPGGGVVWDAVSRGDVGKVWERWAPWYNVHKTFAGLRDAWLEAGNVQAKATMTRLADWIVSTTANLDGAEYRNPVSAQIGDAWEDYGFGDPFVMRYNGRYYLYPSTRDDQVGVKCWSSRDLVSWRYEGLCAVDPTTKGAYAPEIFRGHDAFYMATSPAGKGHYIYRSESPTGPFERATDNFGLSIDGSVFIDDDGEGYFYSASDRGVLAYRMTTETQVDPRPTSEW